MKYKWTGNTKNELKGAQSQDSKSNLKLKDNAQLNKENAEIRFQLNNPMTGSKNKQYDAKNGEKDEQLNPNARQGGVQSSTDNRRSYVQPSTADGRNYVQPSTAYGRNYVQPSTANGWNYVQPSTANGRNYVQPSTANGRKIVQPDVVSKERRIQGSPTMSGYTNTERTGHDYAIEPYSRPILDLTQGTGLSGRNFNRDLMHQEENVLRNPGNSFKTEPKRSGYIQQEPKNAQVNLSQNPPNMGENGNKLNQENAGSRLDGAGLTVNNAWNTNNIESDKSRIEDRSSSKGRKITEAVNPLFRY